MDFDANLKREILENISDSRTYLAGIFSMLARIEEIDKRKKITVSHSMYEIALDVARVIKAQYQRSDIEIAFKEPYGLIKVRHYMVIVDCKTTRKIIEDYDFIVKDNLLAFRNDIFTNNYNNKDKVIAALQGIFLSRGRVFIPNGENSSIYQLEIICYNKQQAKNIRNIIQSLNINIKVFERRENYLLYIKDSEKISDFLALIKASNSVMELQSLIIERDIRNNANRAVNCNVANITKIVKAASEQIEAIKIIDRYKGINSLNDNLKELANLRLNNPESSLSELSNMLKPRITKSGINHRMRKIKEIAEMIKGENDV